MSVQFGFKDTELHQCKAGIFSITDAFILTNFVIMGIVDQHIEHLKRLCLLYHVDKMYLFGSALNSNFKEESDIDLLVKFKPFELTTYFDNYLLLKEQWEVLFGREVDLVEEQTLKNPILIDSINRSKKLLYG
jgi:predicted nucleotidyltransferase